MSAAFECFARLLRQVGSDRNRRSEAAERLTKIDLTEDGRRKGVAQAVDSGRGAGDAGSRRRWVQRIEAAGCRFGYYTRSLITRVARSS